VAELLFIYNIPLDQRSTKLTITDVWYSPHCQFKMSKIDKKFDREWIFQHLQTLVKCTQNKP